MKESDKLLKWLDPYLGKKEEDEEEEDIVCIQCGYKVSLNYPDYDIYEPCPMCRCKL